MASEFTKEDFESHLQRYTDDRVDWSTFEAQGEYKPEYARPHVRMVGSSITGRVDEEGTIPADTFTLSVMMLPPGHEAPVHAHDVEEVFFVTKGEMIASWVHDNGDTFEDVLETGDMVHNPPGILHGIRNHTDEEARVIVLIGSGRPNKPTYLDPALDGT